MTLICRSSGNFGNAESKEIWIAMKYATKIEIWYSLVNHTHCAWSTNFTRLFVSRAHHVRTRKIRTFNRPSDTCSGPRLHCDVAHHGGCTHLLLQPSSHRLQGRNVHWFIPISRQTDTVTSIYTDGSKDDTRLQRRRQRLTLQRWLKC